MPRVLKPCGTIAAYRRHIRRGELVDEDCAGVWAKYQRDYQARRREARMLADDAIEAGVTDPPKPAAPQDEVIEEFEVEVEDPSPLLNQTEAT